MSDKQARRQAWEGTSRRCAKAGGLIGTESTQSKNGETEAGPIWNRVEVWGGE